MYQFNSRVRYSETDVDGKLSLLGIMNYLQDTSTFQSESIGLGLFYLQSINRAWLLSSWHIIIDRYPRLGDEIVLSTWPYEFKGIFGLRNFTIQDTEGNYLVRADSRWFFYDTEKGCPSRVQEEQIRGYGMGEPLDMGDNPRHIEVPDEYEEGEPVLVVKHYIDTNHHVNNAQYVEIAREFIPDGFVIGELRVDYRKAALLGDVMTPHISKIPEGYVIALCDASGDPYAVVWMAEKAGE